MTNIVVVGSGRIPGKEKAIKKSVEVLDEKGKNIGESDLLLKNPTQKEIQEAKAQELLEKYQLEQRMRMKLRQAGFKRRTKKEQHKKNKRNMTKKSRKRNRKK